MIFGKWNFFLENRCCREGEFFFRKSFFSFPKWLGVFARKALQSFALWKNFRFLSLVETIPVVALIKGPFGDVGLLVGCDRREKKG